MHQEDGAEHDYDDEKGSNPDKETDQDCDSANELGECNQETDDIRCVQVLSKTVRARSTEGTKSKSAPMVEENQTGSDPNK